MTNTHNIVGAPGAVAISFDGAVDDEATDKQVFRSRNADGVFPCCGRTADSTFTVYRGSRGVAYWVHSGERV